MPLPRLLQGLYGTSGREFGLFPARLQVALRPEHINEEFARVKLTVEVGQISEERPGFPAAKAGNDSPPLLYTNSAQKLYSAGCIQTSYPGPLY